MKIEPELFEKLKSLILDGESGQAMREYRFATGSDMASAISIVNEISAQVGTSPMAFSYDENLREVRKPEDIKGFLQSKVVFVILRPDQLFLCKPLKNTKGFECYVKHKTGQIVAKVLQNEEALNFALSYLSEEDYGGSLYGDWVDLEDEDLDESQFPDSVILQFPDTLPTVEPEEIIHKEETPANESISSGWIYILANSSMKGILKIGRTDRTPSERADELASATGVPTPFIIVWEEETGNSESAERDVHQFLAQHRVNIGREFFRIDTRSAIEIVSRTCAAYPIGVKKEEVKRVFNPDREDELIMRSLQIVQKNGSIEPRIIRMQLGASFEESRAVFEKLQMMSAIDSGGRRANRY